ncbi:MAG: protein translocase subunit SecD [bacterium]
MSSSKRSWYWGVIIIIIAFCVVIPLLKHQAESNKLKLMVTKGEITQEEAKISYINLGLDLAGGVDLLYQAQSPSGSKEVTQDQMVGLVEIIRRRIDPEGIKEPIVQQIGNDRLNIQVPGETDPEKVKERIEQTALMRFIDAQEDHWLADDIVILLAEGEEPPDENGDQAASSDGTQSDGEASDAEEGTVDGESADGEPSDEAATSERKAKTIYVPADRVILEGSMLKSASLGLASYGGYQVDISFDRAGSRIFAEYTARNVGRHLAIVLDDKVISCPTIQSAIPHGSGFISGDFTANEAKELAILLQSGALPVKLEILQSRAVGPSLGQESIDLSVKAAMIGLIFVMLFMIVYYRLVGLMADLALCFYAFVFMGVLSSFGVTLTLPGIAGFILSLGMAVDANVIIFERIKEEINIGKTYRAAIEAGFERAWPAILDGNVTTLITGMVLYMVGSGTIKGFAVTLNIGILISMFSALIVTRSLIYIWSGTLAFQKPFLFGFGTTGRKQ